MTFEEGKDRDGTSMQVTESAAVKDWAAAMRCMVRARRALGRPHADVRLWWEMFRPASLPRPHVNAAEPTPPSAGDGTPEPAETISGRRCGVCGGPVNPDRKYCSVPCYERSRAPKCGTPYGARKHRQNGEPICDPCREAERAKGRQWRNEFIERYRKAVAS